MKSNITQDTESVLPKDKNLTQKHAAIVFDLR